MLDILICSVGRRNYLIDWFRDALKREGINGRVITTDADPQSAGASAGDDYFVAPQYTDTSYAAFMKNLLSEIDPALFISANDFEISHVSQLISLGQIQPTGCHFFPSWDAQQLIEDKYHLAQALSETGITTPYTVLASDIEMILAEFPGQRDFIVKHRYGSGSSGLRRTHRDDLVQAVSGSVAEILEGASHIQKPEDSRQLAVIQPEISGEEYGVDGVYSAFHPGEVDGKLARRKLRMRSGETDKAITVDGTPFAHAIRTVGELLQLRGLVDMDFIVDQNGTPNLIDINPRFGGGYPFMHVAGADAPRHYVRSLEVGAPAPDLLRYSTGVVGAKYENVRRTS